MAPWQWMGKICTGTWARLMPAHSGMRCMSRTCGAVEGCLSHTRANLSRSTMSYNLSSSKSCHPFESEAYRVYNSLYPPNTRVLGYKSLLVLCTLKRTSSDKKKERRSRWQITHEAWVTIQTLLFFFSFFSRQLITRCTSTVCGSLIDWYH